MNTERKRIKQFEVMVAETIRETDLPPHMYPHPELGCGC